MLMSKKMEKLLQGEYHIVNGEERLYIDKDTEKYIISDSSTIFCRVLLI